MHQGRFDPLKPTHWLEIRFTEQGALPVGGVPCQLPNTNY